MIPEDITAPLTGVDDRVPLPAVPPQVCVERTTDKFIVEVLSDVIVFPNWSLTAITGSVKKFTLVVALTEG